MARFMMFLPVLAIFAVTAPNAQAGFEFVPAKTGMAPNTQRQQSVSVPPQNLMPVAPMPIAPMMASPDVRSPMAFPAAPVMRAPINQPMGNVAPPPQPNYQRQPIMQPAPVKKTGGLYIDPYPLKNGAKASASSVNQAVAQGMAEKSGGLHPVQLGSGMTSGANPTTMASNVPMQPRTPAMRPDMGRIMNSGLTPVPGGEPAPLPNVAGIEDAYRNSSIQSQQMPVQYANAVGFGKDLPVELALSQVVPSGFTYEVVGNLDQSKMVTWEGGEPWNVVLNKMLRAQNMVAVINGDQVTIQPMARL